MCIYSNRLTAEWIKYGKIIIAVDYDDTLYPWDAFNNGRDRARTIKLVKRAQRLGCYVVIFTSSEKERYNEIIKYCTNIGINIDTINKNPIELPYGNTGKIFYNINLCDKSGLRSSINILKRAIFNYKEFKKRQTLTNEA